jgi:hypothetical protein
MQPLILLGQALGVKLGDALLRILLGWTIVALIAGATMIVHGFGAFGVVRRLRIRSPLVVVPRSQSQQITKGDVQSTLLGVKGTQLLHTGPPIPIPNFEVEMRVQNPTVYVAVTNNSAPAPFRAQVIEVRDVRIEPAVPWSVLWREGETYDRALAQGETQLLTLGRGDAMGNALDATTRREEGIRIGLFHFRTPDGDATVEINGLRRFDDLYRTGFSIRLRIYYANQGEDYLLRIGFLNAKDPNGTVMVQATVAPWVSR